MEPPLLLFVLVAGMLDQAKARAVGVRKGIGCAPFFSEERRGNTDAVNASDFFIAPFLRGATARGEDAENNTLSIPSGIYDIFFSVNILSTLQIYTGRTVRSQYVFKDKIKQKQEKELIYEMSTMRPT